MNNLKLISIFIFMVLTACQTSQKKSLDTLSAEQLSNVPKYSWETKAQVRDLKKHKVNNLTIDFLAIKNYQLRLEIQATLGIPVGTLGMNNEKFIAILYTQKKVFQGRVNEKVLSKAFHLPIPPEALYSIAFDEPIIGQFWSCSKNKEQVVSNCENSKTSMRVLWLNRTKEGTKLVKIQGPTMEVDWFFKAPEELKPSAETFTINIPDGYKNINID
ncbi:MAG: hypothetical protein KDD45_09640 [Bdellovibrionales bacterium]|nr:hypothetical protein [Bdellovibrionales bacterium]